MYLDRDTLSSVPRSGYITARAQSMVESGVTECGKNTRLPVFFFMDEHNNTNMKPQAKKVTIFKVIPEEKQRNSSWWRKKMQII